MPARSKIWGACLLLAGSINAQSSTSSAQISMMSSTTSLQLAAMYQGNSFLTGFSFFTADDPTGGYVNYVDQGTAQSEGLISFDNTGAFIMRADSTNLATGRGRDSVRIGSNDYWNDGVYILDLNHMPVGCGVWPAFWTVVENGWPVGGEIDIIEGANMPPTFQSTAWAATIGKNATANINSTLGNVPSLAQDAVSLHTSDMCALNNQTFMSGTIGSDTCSAYLNSNVGCGVVLAPNTTFGQDTIGRGLNAGGGGWYAMWRDIQGSGGVYVYYWPRNSPNVPDDVRNSNTQSTNVTNWGQPAANLTVPCRSDFGNHVIVFNIAFCGDYSAATYGASGCPGSCTSFVAQTPGAFSEAYWSINSLRVYTASGQSVTRPKSGLAMGAIIGIAVGGAVALILLALGLWRYKVVKRRRRESESANATLALMAETGSDDRLKSFSALASGNPFGHVPDLNSDGSITPPGGAGGIPEIPIIGPGAARAAALVSQQKKRSGKTSISAHKTAMHALDGETGAGYYHQQMDDAELEKTSTGAVAINAFTTLHLAPDARINAQAGGSVENKKKKTSVSSEPARSRQPSLAPPGLAVASQRSRMKSVPNIGDRGYVSGSSMSNFQNTSSASAGGGFVRAAGGDRKSSFQQAAGAQRSWVG